MEKTWLVKLKRPVSAWDCNSPNAHAVPAGTILYVKADMLLKKYYGRHGDLCCVCTKEDFDVIKEDKPNG